jgi:hypothetical protein
MLPEDIRSMGTVTCIYHIMHICESSCNAESRSLTVQHEPVKYTAVLAGYRAGLED